MIGKYTEYNKNRQQKLGAQRKNLTCTLTRKLLFKVLQQTNLNICWVCKEKIETLQDFSLDHRVEWGSSENPRETFTNPDNIEFAHRDCNYVRSRYK
jgi:hypothetical protein